MAPAARPSLFPPAERPSLVRTRSNTSPADQIRPQHDELSNPTPSANVNANSSANATSTEPKAQLLSPTKVLSATSSGPSGSDHEHRRSRHRHTQSEHHRGRTRSYRTDKNDGLRHLTAGLAAEHRRAEPRMPFERWSSRQGDLRRMASHRGEKGRSVDLDMLNAGSGYADLKGRGSGKREIEMLLDKADAEKRAKRAAISRADVERLQKRTAEAEKELQDRLGRVGQTAVDMAQALDSTYYSLLERVGNLAALVQSFQNLHAQMKQLLESFAKEASTLETEITAKASRLKASFDEREELVKEFEERGVSANARAQSLNTRLEKARQRLEEWKEREQADRRRRNRFWKLFWSALFTTLAVSFFAFTWTKWKEEAEMVKLAMGSAGGDASSWLGENGTGVTMRTPDDSASVQSVLRGGEEECTSPVIGTATSSSSACGTSVTEADRRLEVLDEILHL